LKVSVPKPTLVSKSRIHFACFNGFIFLFNVFKMSEITLTYERESNYKNLDFLFYQIVTSLLIFSKIKMLLKDLKPSKHTFFR
jgi:hypothetical protein